MLLQIWVLETSDGPVIDRSILGPTAEQDEEKNPKDNLQGMTLKSDINFVAVFSALHLVSKAHHLSAVGVYIGLWKSHGTLPRTVSSVALWVAGEERQQQLWMRKPGGPRHVQACPLGGWYISTQSASISIACEGRAQRLDILHE